MKIWCQLPVKLPVSEFKYFYQLNQDNLELIKRPDTSFVIRDVPTGLPNAMQFIGPRQVHEKEILKSMLRADKEGYDAIVAACFTDDAVMAAGNLMDIPVIGASSAAMAMAKMMGHTYAIVTTNPRFLPTIDQRMKELGMKPFAINLRPIRYLAGSASFWDYLKKADYKPIIEDFLKIARGCIEDGAEVIVAGCGALGPALSVNHIKEIDGVPVIDPVRAALKIAEMMVDFNKSGMPAMSSAGFFLKADEANIAGIRKFLGVE